MINPLSIELHPAASRAWLIFESMNTSVRGTLDCSRAHPFIDSGLTLRVLFLLLNSPPTALHITHSLVGSTRLATDQQSSLQSP
jgi:hypothetical protein